MNQWLQLLELLIYILSALICKTFQFLEFNWKLCTFVP
jgi:hypothetical protein